MEFTSRKKRSTRIGVRILGCLFCLGAVIYILRTFKHGISGIAVVGLAIAFAFFVVGGMYLKQSFSVTAYDITYYVKPEYLELDTCRGRKRIDYKDIKDLSISQVSQGMDYYVIHILTPKYNLVIHILNEKEKAQNMYQLLLEFSGQKEADITSK